MIWCLLWLFLSLQLSRLLSSMRLPVWLTCRSAPLPRMWPHRPIRRHFSSRAEYLKHTMTFPEATAVMAYIPKADRKLYKSNDCRLPTSMLLLEQINAAYFVLVQWNERVGLLSKEDRSGLKTYCKNNSIAIKEITDSKTKELSELIEGRSPPALGTSHFSVPPEVTGGTGKPVQHPDTTKNKKMTSSEVLEDQKRRYDQAFLTMGTKRAMVNKMTMDYSITQEKETQNADTFPSPPVSSGGSSASLSENLTGKPQLVNEEALTLVKYWKENIGPIKSIVANQLLKVKTQKSKPLVAPVINSKPLRKVVHGTENKEKFRRLEFLGDRVATYMISKVMIEQYSDIPLADVSMLNYKLISNKQMYHYALAYDLPRAKQLAHSGSEKAVSDIFEAYLGAIEKEDGDSTRRIHSWISEIFNNVVFTLIIRGIIRQLSTIHLPDKGMEKHFQDLQKSLTEMVALSPIHVIDIESIGFFDVVSKEYKTKHFYDLEALFKKMNGGN